MTGYEPTLMRYVRTFAPLLLLASIVALAFAKFGPYRFGPFEFASPAWTFWILVPAIIASALAAYVKLLPDNTAVWRAQVSEAAAQTDEASDRTREHEAAELIEAARADAATLIAETRAEADAKAAELIEAARADAATLIAETRAEADAKAAELIEAARADAATLIAENAEFAREDAAVVTEREVEYARALWMERGSGFPTVVAMLEEIDERQDEDVSDWLASKGSPAPKAAEVVREHARRRRVAERERRSTQSVIEYYESIAPFLSDLKEEVFGEDEGGLASTADPVAPPELRDPIVDVAIVEHT